MAFDGIPAADNTEYELLITTNALEYMQSYKQDHFPAEDMAIVLADLHTIGSAMLIMLVTFAEIENNSNYRMLFPKGYRGYPYAIFVDRQVEREGYLIHKMVIDIAIAATPINKGKPMIVFKNPEFECYNR